MALCRDCARISEVNLDFRDTARGIVEKQNDEKWYEQRDRIEEALRDAYAAGFTAGSIREDLCSRDGKPCGPLEPHVHLVPTTACIVAPYDTDGGAALEYPIEGCAV